MPTFLDTPHHKFDFTLIKIAEINYKLFLNSNNPEVKMLGILANFSTEESYEAVKSIINGIQALTKGDFAESRYFKQLRIFVQLRSSVQQQFEKAMETVTKFFKEENDFLYRKGEASGELRGELRGEARGEIKGEEKKSRAVVENLIIKLDWTDEQAAEFAEVDINFVKKVRADLKMK